MCVCKRSATIRPTCGSLLALDGGACTSWMTSSLRCSFGLPPLSGPLPQGPGAATTCTLPPKVATCSAMR